MIAASDIYRLQKILQLFKNAIINYELFWFLSRVLYANKTIDIANQIISDF